MPTQFTCNACRKRSGFTLQGKQPPFKVEIPGRGRYRETITRAYLCENCKAENVLTQPDAFWHTVDESDP